MKEDSVTSVHPPLYKFRHPCCPMKRTQRIVANTGKEFLNMQCIYLCRNPPYTFFCHPFCLLTQGHEDSQLRTNLTSFYFLKLLPANARHMNVDYLHQRVEEDYTCSSVCSWT